VPSQLAEVAKEDHREDTMRKKKIIKKKKKIEERKGSGPERSTLF